MSKYNSLKFLKRTKARASHRCEKCGKTINSSRNGDVHIFYKIKVKELLPWW